MAKPLGDTGQWAVRHNAKTVLTLDDLGYQTPALSEGYDWPAKFELYDHQKVTAEFMAKHHRAWCTNGMRSGKTTSGGSAISLAKSVRDVEPNAKVLILCPINVMTTAWYRELKAINRKGSYYVSKQSTAAVTKALESGDIDTLILNHDKLPYLAEVIDEWLGQHGVIVVDEAHAFRNKKTDRYKNLHYLCDPSHEKSKDRWLWLFTGTPVPNEPPDMYHLQKLIDPTRVPSSEREWRSMTMSYFEFDVPVRPGSSRTRKVRKWQTLQVAEKLIADAMWPCIRFRTQDCVELPEQAYSYYDCGLDPAQKKMIKELVAGYATSHGDKQIVAANAGVRVSKILQVCSGSVLNEDGTAVDVGAKTKMNCLLELIDQNEGKTLVFCVYKAAQLWIQKELAKKKIKSEIINGEVAAGKRQKIVDQFQTRRTPQVLILHPQCEGMTLTAAMVSAWWGPPDSNLQWTQANERMRGPSQDGKDRKTLVAMLYGSKLEHERYLKRIESDDRQTRTIDIYAEAIKEFGSKQALEELFAGDDGE